MTNIRTLEDNTKHNQDTHTKCSGEISVDSLKIRIPLHLCKVVDSCLTDKYYLVNASTGDYDESYFKQNSLCKKSKGISIRFAIETQMTSFRTKENYLTILLPSKALKQRYFEGFTLDNIEVVYNELMQLEVVSFSLKDFLNSSACTDVDFKRDFITKDLNTIIRQIGNNSKLGQRKNEGYRSFNRKDNVGIEYSDRRTTAFKSNPYLKVYHKQLELDCHSTEFTEAYLQGIDYTDIARIETTVKNKKHFNYLGINNTSLHAILSLTKEQKYHILSDSVNKHLEPRTREIGTPSEIKPNIMVMYKLIALSMQQGLSYNAIKDIATNGIDNKSTKSRKRKELDEIYFKYIKDTDTDKLTKDLDAFYDFIGWS